MPAKRPTLRVEDRIASRAKKARVVNIVGDRVDLWVHGSSNLFKNVEVLGGTPAQFLSQNDEVDIIWGQDNRPRVVTGDSDAYNRWVVNQVVIPIQSRNPFPRQENTATPPVPKTPCNYVFTIDGALAPVTDLTYFKAIGNMTINDVHISLYNTGAEGSTIIDVNINGNSIFTNQDNRPLLAHDNEAKTAVSGTPDLYAVVAGDVVTVDIDQVAPNSSGLNVVIDLDCGGSDVPIVPPDIISFVYAAPKDTQVFLHMENLTESVPIDWGDGATSDVTHSEWHTVLKDGYKTLIIYKPASGWGVITQLEFDYGRGLFPNLSKLTACTSVNFYKDEVMIPSDERFSSVLPSMAALTSLTGIFLTWNNLLGSIPSFSANTALLYFYGEHNKFSGTLPSFNACVELKQFEVGFNQLSGTLPSFIDCVDLEDFFVNDNQFSGTLPEFYAPNCNYFYACNNQFSGTLPSFANVGLWNLLLYNNQFSGTLPSFNGCSALHVFYIYDNEFSGTMPDFNQYSTLMMFDVHNNHFSGTLPDFRGFYEMYLFNANDNELTACYGFNGMTDLRYLGLSNNQITGNLPSVVGSPVEEYNMSNNGFTGYVDGTILTDVDSFPTNLDVSHNSLPQSAVDNILADIRGIFQDNWHIEGFLDLHANAAPSSQGYADKAYLIAHGMNVITD